MSTLAGRDESVPTSLRFAVGGMAIWMGEFDEGERWLHRACRLRWQPDRGGRQRERGHARDRGPFGSPFCLGVHQEGRRRHPHHGPRRGTLPLAAVFRAFLKTRTEERTVDPLLVAVAMIAAFTLAIVALRLLHRWQGR